MDNGHKVGLVFFSDFKASYSTFAMRPSATFNCGYCVAGDAMEKVRIRAAHALLDSLDVRLFGSTARFGPFSI